jgi:CheY-like chemotaxis protein
MKTAYNILWIDDEPTSVDTDREDVKEYLEEFGIRADINFVEAPADGSIKERLEHHLKDPELDLLMVDYHMDGLSGDQLVRLIRETDHIYLPVIFYSSSTVSDLLDAVRAAELDGVYIANRDLLINKVKEVVGSLLVKEQTVKQVRGLLMEGVSEIDAQFNEIFQRRWSMLQAEHKQTVLDYLKTILAGRVKSAAKKVENFPSDAEGFNQHITKEFLTSSYDTYTRWRLTGKILELTNQPVEDLDELKNFAEMPDGKKSLNGLRNDYAHISRKLLEAEHDTEKCIKIRQALRTQNANIDAILGTVE